MAKIQKNYAVRKIWKKNWTKQMPDMNSTIKIECFENFIFFSKNSS